MSLSAASDVDSSIPVESFTIADTCVFGNVDLHAKLHPQLVTDVPSVNLVALRVFEKRCNAFDVMTSLHERDFHVLFIESDHVLLQSAITLGKVAIRLFVVLTNHSFNALNSIAIRHQTIRCVCRMLTNLVRQDQPQRIAVDTPLEDEWKPDPITRCTLFLVSLQL